MSGLATMGAEATRPRERAAPDVPAFSPRAFVVVPCLNEIAGLDVLLRDLLAQTEAMNALIVVADGGSTDGSRARIAHHGARSGGRVRLLDNPARLQSAGINRAVARFGGAREFVIRVDAHGALPPRFIATLLEEAEATGADSVTCALRNSGSSPFQRAVALAQSSPLGNGGAAHRMGPGEAGRWVEHGHHALMRVDAFRAAGGYDETFRANEDAELDLRLAGAGARIWLTGRVAVTYHPRARPAALFRQYWHYGRGRARTVRKHRLMPRMRQLLPLAVAPALVGLPLAAFLPIAAVPALLWGGASLCGGALIGARSSLRDAALVPLAVLIMHAAWSFGFWRQALAVRAGGAS